MKKLFALSLMLFIISACSSADEVPAPQKFREQRFDAQQVIDLKVNKIDVVSEFMPSFTRPNVEHLFPISIEKTAMNWGNDRLRAVDFSSAKKATFIIKDASVTEEIVKSEKFFEKDSLKYRARLAVVLKVSDTEKFANAETSLEAWRELTIPADTPIDQKEIYWKNMVDKLFHEFDARMQTNIHKYLNMYVDNSQYITDYD
ncbi:MAG: hypothetical protein J6Y53_03830 [Alphaproteobacteria bacterium]|nr:hypothetical protein [Alphaproteobacteria bacterium]